MRQLSINELLRYDWRLKNFIQRYREGAPFELMGNTKVRLVYEEEIEQILAQKKYINFVNLKFTDQKIPSKQYRLSSFKMVPEFGGKPERKFTFHDDKNVHSITTQFDTIRSTTGTKTVSLKIDNQTFSVTECIKTEEGKSSLHFIDEKETPVIWISHKKGTRPSDYESWATLTEPAIAEHPETQAFIKEVQKKYPKEIPAAACFGRKIDDSALSNFSLYGSDYNIGKHFSQNNVHAIMGGAIRVVSDGNHYTLRANRMHYNGNLVLDTFRPILAAMFVEGNTDYGIRNAKFQIQPMLSRKVTEWL